MVAGRLADRKYKGKHDNFKQILYFRVCLRWENVTATVSVYVFKVDFSVKYN